MHKNYRKFNLLGLLAILAGVFVLVFLFEDSETKIAFEDPGLEAAVRETIEKEEGTIVQKDIDTLQVLDASNRQIENLEGIEYLIELRELNLEDNFVKSVTPLKANTKLDDLNLRNNEITSLEEIDFQDIIYLNIRKLSLRHNVKRDDEGKGTRLSDISLLRQMASLRKLSLRDNHIEDLSPLSDLRRLTELDIRENKFETIEPLAVLTRLQELNLRDNKIKSLEPIKYLSRLTYLNIHSNTQLEAPILSQESGFYKENFLLEIENKIDDAEIYYTLDGSEPTIDSKAYKEPIPIESMDDNSAAVVRAKILREDNTLSETVTKTYFVNDQINERFDLPIFSLVTDPDNLFDEETGIYENYDNRGSKWERPVHIEYLKNNGDLLISQNAGIRIHGGMTRGSSQKSLRLYADSVYDEKDTFKYNFFESINNNNYKRLILRNSGNDGSQTMFNDALMQSLVERIGTVDTQAYQPAVVFINGEYHGFQNIRERMDEYYLSDHYDIDINELTILENNAELYRGGNKDVYHYTNMIKYIEENGVRNDKHLNHIETMMDFDNYIDYFASEIYFGNADWPGNNIKFWRKTTDEYVEDDRFGHDGRWRWMLYDTDFGFYKSDEPWGAQNQPVNHKHNTIHWVMTELDGVRGNRTWPNFLFRELMQNEQFKNQFLARFNDLANSYLGQTAANLKIDEMKNRIKNEIPYQVERWGVIESYTQWEDYVDRKYLFAKERPAYIRDFIIDEFELGGTVELKLSNETDHGYIRLNRMDIVNELPGNEEEELWSGLYFKEIPITVEAIPKEGYEFSHWEDFDSTDNYLEIIPEKDMKIKAVFIEK